MIWRILLCLSLILGTPSLAQQANLRVGGAENVSSKVFAFGGGVWRVPKVMRLAEPSLIALGEGGTYRAALAWEMLAKLSRPEDVTAILAAYPLNDFLAARAKAGGTIIVSLDATPLFLAQDKSARALADGPAWARAPIASEAQWAEIVRLTVRHFNKIGINPIIEVWNEPDHSLKGQFSDYIRLYRATTVGARKANSKTRLAGPALSDWTSTLPGGQRYAEAFFAAAAGTGAPSVGLSRLPIDAVTYHSFGRVPASHHARVMADIRRLAQAYGYRMPAVYNSEWNIAAEPPYPEGDLNGEFPGAAHIGASLIAMARAGLRGQTFQMMIDPGAKGYSAGVMTVAGSTRAAYHAFSLARPFVGSKVLNVSSDSDVVTAVATRRGGKLYVLVAAFAPTDLMLIRDAMEPVALERPAVFQELTKLPANAVKRFFGGNGRPPGASAAGQQALLEGRERFRAAQQRREAWRNGGQIVLSLPGAMQMTSYQLIDRSTAPKGNQVAQYDRKTNSQLKRDIERAAKEVQRLGLADQGVRDYLGELGERVDGRQALGRASGGVRAQIAPIDQSWATPTTQRIAGIAAGQAQALVQPVQGGRQQQVKLKTQPYALHLLVFQ